MAVKTVIDITSAKIARLNSTSLPATQNQHKEVQLPYIVLV